MAIRKSKILHLGQEKGAVGITGGPDAWDMWLCMRSVGPEVVFYVDQPLRIVARDSSTFFTATVSSMGLVSDEPLSDTTKLVIHGRTSKLGSRFPFRMTYDTHKKTGDVEFL